MRLYSYAELQEEKRLLTEEMNRVFTDDDGPKPDLAVVAYQISMVDFMSDAIAPPQYARRGKDPQCL